MACNLSQLNGFDPFPMIIHRVFRRELQSTGKLHQFEWFPLSFLNPNHALHFDWAAHPAMYNVIFSQIHNPLCKQLLIQIRIEHSDKTLSMETSTPSSVIISLHLYWTWLYYMLLLLLLLVLLLQKRFIRRHWGWHLKKHLFSFFL